MAAWASGELSNAAGKCLPAEIQLIRVASTWFVAWPGEVFVAFAQRIHKEFPRAWIITLANGELQGYLTTSEAVEKHWYEASNAIFASPASGDILVETTSDLLRQIYFDDDVNTLKSKDRYRLDNVSKSSEVYEQWPSAKK